MERKRELKRLQGKWGEGDAAWGTVGCRMGTSGNMHSGTETAGTEELGRGDGIVDGCQRLQWWWRGS